jgi:VWFA-related protein
MRAAAFAATLLVFAALGRFAAAPPDSFTFTPDTTVHIDAGVFDARGRFLDTLTEKDFVLAEDGVPQKLESVRLVRSRPEAAATAAPDPAPADPDERTAAKRANARLFALYLDEYHVSPEGAERIRPVLNQFVDGLAPADLLVVMKPLDSILTIRLTTDRGPARDAIAAFTGRRGDYEARNEYEREFMASTPVAVERARMQVTLSALEALAVHLGWASDETRKTLIVVTSELAHGQRRRGLALPDMDSISHAANRFNVAVYPVDPGTDASGTPEGEAPSQALAKIAAFTDGHALTPADDPVSGFRRIVADASDYYLITYKSPKKIDGHFHEIQLQVKRKNARVRTRQGYWAMSADELMRAELAARDAIPKKVRPVEPPRHISTLIRPWFGLSRGDNGQTRVTFVWEPVRTLGDRNHRIPARLELIALGSDDATVFQGDVRPTGPGAIDDGAEPLRAVFDVPPGYVRLRMKIQDGAARMVDSDVREISVRDLRGPVVMATPEVFRARNAREFRAVAGDSQAAPVAAREFSRTERLLIRVHAYSASGDRPSVSARLLNRLGQEMRMLDVAPGSGVGSDQIDLPLASLAAGEYTVELRAVTAQGEVKDLLNFRVTN